MDKKSSQIIALKALEWVIADDDLCGIFMGSSGLSPDDLRSGAGSGELLLAVMDFLAMDDAWVIGFATHAGLACEDLMAARQGLPGGENIHWT